VPAADLTKTAASAAPRAAARAAVRTRRRRRADRWLRSPPGLTLRVAPPSHPQRL